MDGPEERVIPGREGGREGGRETRRREGGRGSLSGLVTAA
jgi:hypothetical protein